MAEHKAVPGRVASAAAAMEEGRIVAGVGVATGALVLEVADVAAAEEAAAACLAVVVEQPGAPDDTTRV